MPTLSVEQFMAMFTAARSSVERLESRSHTDVPAERDDVAKFVAGQLPPERRRDPDRDTWGPMVRRHVEAGGVFRRVRVMDEPLTAYNRFMVYCARASVKLGEDIRFLSRSDANALDLPDHDFWVFDRARMAELRFTADGRPLLHDLLDDPQVVARHAAWIDEAFAAATPWADYLAEDPTRERPPAESAAESVRMG